MRAISGSVWSVRIALLLGFTATRILYARTGLRFDASTIHYFAQLLDPPLLRERLLESLFYLHAQPPLLNLLTGLALKAAPETPGPLLHAVFLAAGFATCAAVAGSVRRLGVNRWAAAGLALVFSATPPALLYENWYFYPHLEQALLALAAYAFARAKGAAGIGLAFWALALLVALRSLFHPMFLLFAIAAAAGLVPSRERRRVLLAGAGPALLVVLLATKNLVLFGFFGTSSWGGNSLHRVVTQSLRPAALTAMVDAGRLSPISLRWEFSPPEVYLRILGGGPDRGVPALDTTGKTRPSENPVNYNHWIYPIASRVYFRDALVLIAAHPGAYLHSLARTARRYLDPVVDDRFLASNRVHLEAGTRLSAALEASRLYRLVVLAAVAWAAFVLVTRRAAPAERLLLAFALGTIAWVSALGILLEYGENNRFRYPLLVLVLILVVHGARDLSRGLGTLARRRGAGD